MNLRRTALAGVAGALALAPAAPVHAAGPHTDNDKIDPLLRMASRAHDLGKPGIAHLRHADERLEDHRRRARLRGQAPATPPYLQAIAACESGGNPAAVDASGTYRGKYQFDLQTWASVGGSGDPATAPEAEQDRRAAILYSRVGASAWPICGA